jgi:hypothetical protein
MILLPPATLSDVLLDMIIRVSERLLYIKRVREMNMDFISKTLFLLGAFSRFFNEGW